jgi:hypothetical protein
MDPRVGRGSASAVFNAYDWLGSVTRRLVCSTNLSFSSPHGPATHRSSGPP